MDFIESLNKEKKEYIVATNGGIAMPVAGSLYWFGLAAAGLYLSVKGWALLAFYTSGLIFPLGLLLAKFIKSNLLLRTSLTSVLLPAFISMFLFFPSAIAAFIIAPELVPLILAIGMSVHWPVLGWAYGITRIFAGHAIVRAIAVTAIWFLLPEYRLTLLPLSVSFIYLGTVPIILSAVKKADKDLNQTNTSEPLPV